MHFVWCPRAQLFPEIEAEPPFTRRVDSRCQGEKHILPLGPNVVKVTAQAGPLGRSSDMQFRRSAASAHLDGRTFAKAKPFQIHAEGKGSTLPPSHPLQILRFAGVCSHLSSAPLLPLSLSKAFFTHIRAPDPPDRLPDCVSLPWVVPFFYILPGFLFVLLIVERGVLKSLTINGRFISPDSSVSFHFMHFGPPLLGA